MTKKAEATEAQPTPEYALLTESEQPQTITITLKRVGKNSMVPRISGSEGHIDGRKFNADPTWSSGYYLEIDGQKYVIGAAEAITQMYGQITQQEA